MALPTEMEMAIFIQRSRTAGITDLTLANQFDATPRAFKDIVARLDSATPQ